MSSSSFLSNPTEEINEEGRCVIRRTIYIPNDHPTDDYNNNKEELQLMMLGCEDNPPYGPTVSTAHLFLELICKAILRKKGVDEKLEPASSDGGGGGSTSSDCPPVPQHDNNYTNEINTPNLKSISVSIDIYRAQIEQYPKDTEEWDKYHGIIIPGSFSSAHDSTKDWIMTLRSVMQNEIHGNQRKTLAVCFGHQLYAHSFSTSSNAQQEIEGGGGEEEEEKTSKETNENIKSRAEKCNGGLAVKCPAGVQTGRRVFHPTCAGVALLNLSLKQNDIDYKNHNGSINDHDKTKETSTEEGKNTMELLHTHGDMVQSLPLEAVSLGGNDIVPVLAAAYFATKEEADAYRMSIMSADSSLSSTSSTVNVNDNPTNEGSHDKGGQSVIPTATTSAISTNTASTDNLSKPYAITFQAHPEYATRDGLNVTFFNILTALTKRGEITSQAVEQVEEDVIKNYDAIEKDSVDIMEKIGMTLGWF